MEEEKIICAITIGPASGHVENNAVSAVSMAKCNFLRELVLLIEKNVKKVEIKTVFQEWLNCIEANFILNFDCNVSDGEFLYLDQSDISKGMAEIFSKRVSNNNRGIKPLKPGNCGIALIEKTRVPFVICKPFFITNSPEIAKAANVYALAIDEIADLFT